MLGLLVCSLLSFAPPPSGMSRREAAFAAALSVATLTTPLPAFAQRSKLIPRSNAESTANFKAYQISKPGEETPEFREAERKRLAAANGGGSKAKESDADQMKRLGLKTYDDALTTGGYDPCSSWRGC